MNRRRRRVLILARNRWADWLIIVVLFVAMVSALFLWPDKAIAGVAIPTAFLIGFYWWRER